MARSQQQPMIYFSSLELENVRCFGERQVLELTDEQGRPARWTLLLGENGVGKTTLLECLAWMRPTEAGPPDVIEPVLNTEEDNAVFNSLLRAGSEVKVDLKATFTKNQGLGVAKRDIQRIQTGISMVGRHGQLHDRNLTTNSFPGAPQDLVFLELPIFAYGAARRKGTTNLDKSALSDPLASLFSTAAELYDAEEILLNLDYLATRKRGRHSQQRLQQAKEILATILPDVQNTKSINILGPKVPGEPERPSGVQFVMPTGVVPLSGLSLGYQTTLAWVIDLAYRLYERYPNSTNPLAAPAIVLVDEIDLHLHPRWQRQIMSDLTQHFPRTQFIATAHSPLMVQAATDANLAVLHQKDGRVIIENRPRFVESWRVDQILTSELFGLPSARSRRIERLMEERNALLDKLKRSPKEEERLRVLEDELDGLPTAERHADKEAMDLIRQAATILKGQAAHKQ